jgi:hypothetical protein
MVRVLFSTLFMILVAVRCTAVPAQEPSVNLIFANVDGEPHTSNSWTYQPNALVTTAHGLPSSTGEPVAIYNPNTSSLHVGHVEYIHPEYDLAIVQPAPGVTYQPAELNCNPLRTGDTIATVAFVGPRAAAFHGRVLSKPFYAEDIDHYVLPVRLPVTLSMSGAPVLNPRTAEVHSMVMAFLHMDEAARGSTLGGVMPTEELCAALYDYSSREQ